ncbi:MAG: CBS domain-containing protein [Euryarchaeota archaeon]|nr:CBS domain-containing protein [Euryarchaeota archaeon]
MGDKDHMDIQYVLKHFYRVPVETVMRKDIWNLPIAYVDTPIEHIFSIMTARRHVWIVEKKGSMKLKGIITEKDLMEVMIPHRVSPYMVGSYNIRSLLLGNIRTAEDIMVRKVVLAHPKDTIEDALEKMMAFRIRRLPVVDKKGNLVGELTIKTLIIQFRKILNWYRITKDERSES